jgi:hypothetical protein
MLLERRDKFGPLKWTRTPAGPLLAIEKINMPYLQASAPPRARYFSVTLVVMWLIAASAGVCAMLRWQNTPALKAVTVASWPAQFPISLDANAANLIMVAHPKCPCSRASLAELLKVITRAGTSSIRASILHYRPSGEDDSWLRGSFLTEASAIPGVKILSDTDGEWAARLGATASGHVFLFDRTGSLLFEGGITAGRGHEGENAGSAAVCDLLAGRKPETRSTPVFGCAIAEEHTLTASRP